MVLNCFSLSARVCFINYYSFKC